MRAWWRLLAIAVVDIVSATSAGAATLTIWHRRGQAVAAAYSAGHLAVRTYGGRIYGVPLTTETSLLAWNKDLFTRAGLDPEKRPASWTEWREDAARVTALGGDICGFYFSGACGGCALFTITPLVWASGGQFLDADGTRVTVDIPQFADAVAFYRSLIAGAMVPAVARTDTGSSFLSIVDGRIGMQSIGTSQISVMATRYPHVPIGVALLPGRDGRTSFFIGGDNTVVTKRAKSMRAIQAFVEYVCSVDGQRIMAAHGSLPARSDIAAEVLAGQDPGYAVAVAVFGDMVNSPNSPWTEVMQAAIFGPDPAGAIRDGQARMQGVIDDSR